MRPSSPPAPPPRPAPAARRVLARLTAPGAWVPGDDRHPGHERIAGLALLERLRYVGYSAIAVTPPHAKKGHTSGRQPDAPEYVVTLTSDRDPTVQARGSGSRLERAV